MSLHIIKEIVNAVENDGAIDKAEAFKIVGLLQIEAGFKERKITGETGEFIAGKFYDVEPNGGNTAGYDLIDKDNRRVQVKMRHNKSDVDGLKLENVDVICVIVYDDNYSIEGIYEATPKEFFDNVHRSRPGGYSAGCKKFVSYAKKVGNYEI